MPPVRAEASRPAPRHDAPMLLPLTEDDGVLLELRYATADNLTGRPIYLRPVALLLPEAHERLLAAAARAAVLGFRLRVFDAFRPLDAQWAFWAALPDPRYVANPADDSGYHPRGAAVDLTLVDPADGTDLDMGTGFDAMVPQSAHAALDIPPHAVRNRALLLGIMAGAGWQHIASEWWHYQLPDAGALPLLWASDVSDGPM
jgi:zinc D-Ala-D-Ala dipeptidase